MKSDRELLEDILTAQVLLLSKAIDEEKRSNGTRRAGGDYTRDAVAEIKKSKSKILEMLHS